MANVSLIKDPSAPIFSAGSGGAVGAGTLPQSRGVTPSPGDNGGISEMAKMLEAIAIMKKLRTQGGNAGGGGMFGKGGGSGGATNAAGASAVGSTGSLFGGASGT